MVKTSGTFPTSDRLYSINVDNVSMDTINLINNGFIDTIDIDAESSINNINNAGYIYITGSSQAGRVTMVDQAQLNLQDSTISTLSGYGDFTKLDTNHNSINIHHMQANSNLAVNVTSTSSTSSGGALKVTDHTGTYTIANNGVITKATMGTSASGTNKSTINLYPISTKKYVNCSAGYHTTAEYYTINPYASSIAIPADTTKISILCNTGTSYITYGTSGTAAVSKSFSTNAAAVIPAGTTEYSRCMHLNNNSTSSKTYTIKCLNSSDAILATRTFSVNYRHNILVFSSTRSSVARTIYVQILLD